MLEKDTTEQSYKPDAEHSELGGSSAERWTQCPGSVFLIRQLPPQKSGPDAERGSACHEVFAKLLDAFLQYKEDGTKFDEDAILSELSTDPRVEADRVEDCETLVVDAVEVIWKKVLEETLSGKVYDIETFFSFDTVNGMGGTADFWVAYINDRGQRVLVIFDLKTGRHSVSPKKNGQLAFYACAARRFLKANDKDIDVARLAIFQPNDFNSPEPYKECSITAKQLDAWEKKFINAAHQIYVKKQPKFKIGKHCMFCQGQSLCKKYQQEMSKKASLKLVDVSDSLPSVEVLTPEQRKNIAMHRGQIEAFLKAVYASVVNECAKGIKYDGIKVVLGNGRRTWKDEAIVVSGLKAQGLTEADIYKNKLKGITEIEKKLGKNSCSELTLKPPGKPILVYESDPRPAVSVGQELLEYTDE